LIGHGSFAQVLRCYCKDNNHTYAVKVIKNLPPYIKQAALEKTILEDVFISSFLKFFCLAN
jgi:serine/threonine protein kinase